MARPAMLKAKGPNHFDSVLDSRLHFGLMLI